MSFARTSVPQAFYALLQQIKSIRRGDTDIRSPTASVCSPELPPTHCAFVAGWLCRRCIYGADGGYSLLID